MNSSWLMALLVWSFALGAWYVVLLFWNKRILKRAEVRITMTERQQLIMALSWALRNGVMAVDYGLTGYWKCAGSNEHEIMPPADCHKMLDIARKLALNEKYNELLAAATVTKAQAS